MPSPRTDHRPGQSRTVQDSAGNVRGRWPNVPGLSGGLSRTVLDCPGLSWTVLDCPCSIVHGASRQAPHESHTRVESRARLTDSSPKGGEGLGKGTRPVGMSLRDHTSTPPPAARPISNPPSRPHEPCHALTARVASPRTAHRPGLSRTVQDCPGLSRTVQDSPQDSPGTFSRLPRTCPGLSWTVLDCPCSIVHGASRQAPHESHTRVV